MTNMAEGNVLVKVLGMQDREVTVDKKMTLARFMETCLEDFQEVTPSDVLLFRLAVNEEPQPVELTRARMKAKVNNLGIVAGAAFELRLSSVILTQEDIDFLSEQTAQVFKMKLGPCIYRGSHHGWSREQFDKCCAMKGPVVVVVHATGAGSSEIQDSIRKFGAFVSTNLETGLEKGKYGETPYSFLFNLGTRTTFPVLPEKTKKGIFFSCDGASALLSLGGGDLCIYEDCNVHEFSYSRTPIAFDATVEGLIGSQSMYFGVQNIEAFKLMKPLV